MDILFNGRPPSLLWRGSPFDIDFDWEGATQKLLQLEERIFVVKDFKGRIGITQSGVMITEGRGLQVLAVVNPCSPGELGDPAFTHNYQLEYAYMLGAMANGIASEKLVIAASRAGLLASYGAAGLPLDQVSFAIDRIQSALSGLPCAFNLIHSPHEEALEAGVVDLYLKKKVKIVEASAFLGLTEHVVHYRVAGLGQSADGKIIINHKIIAKISRKEVAIRFMEPAPDHLLSVLVEKGKITDLQAKLARHVPMADDITCEADSGGHTDNQPLVVLLPVIIQLRDEIQKKYQYSQSLRIGAAGGISTPKSAFAAFAMGAAYIVTGSINQACLEAGTSDHVRRLLQGLSYSDVMMAPAADMFEMGVDLQVVKRGTLFGPRAKKLYQYYLTYSSMDEIPEESRTELEQKVFQKPLTEIWSACEDFFSKRDPHQIERAKGNPRRKMALIFRWYLGMSSTWANSGKPDRINDYQIWCGPAMGAFNHWVKGSYLENWKNRQVADVGKQIMAGATYLARLQALRMQGVILPAGLDHFTPN